MKTLGAGTIMAETTVTRWQEKGARGFARGCRGKGMSNIREN